MNQDFTERLSQEKSNALEKKKRYESNDISKTLLGIIA